MSTKFEQLLDYLVNEEMDKANELFHEIVVEKSREIYENLISEEEQETDEAADMEDESVEEEQELEDSFNLEAFGDETDDLLDKTEMPDDEMPGDEMPGDEMPGDEFDSEEPSEDEAMMDIKSAIEELEAAFAELEAAKGEGDMGDEFDSEDDEDEESNEMMGMMPAMESKKRMTREYVEKVGNDWDKNSMKTEGDDAGAGTGETMGKPSPSKSVVSSGKGKPTTGADAGNILGSKSTGEGTNVGTKPAGKAGGLVKPAQDMKTGNVNVPGAKNGVKSLSKAQGHGAEKRGGGEGQAAGAGTGDNSVKGATNTHSTLKKLV